MRERKLTNKEMIRKLSKMQHRLRMQYYSIVGLIGISYLIYLLSEFFELMGIDVNPARLFLLYIPKLPLLPILIISYGGFWATVSGVFIIFVFIPLGKKIWKDYICLPEYDEL